MSFNYQMRFSKTGRARFIAHLDTLSCLVRAVRRTGYKLAFSQGMRPKPLLSLAMPLGVGVEGEDEICDFSLAQRAPLEDLARKLSRELPDGIALKSVAPTYERTKAAARVDSVSYRISLEDMPAALEEAVARYNDSGELVLLRRRPKGDKEVDVKKYIGTLEVDEPGTLTFEMTVTAEGTARPEEVIEALESLGSGSLPVRRITRTAITLKEEPRTPPRPGRRVPRSRRR